MDELMRQEERMTSLQIAEVTGKNHFDVMRAIRKMEPAWEKINESKFALVQYRDAKGEMRPCYSLNKTECLYIATKFNDEARAKLVMRWEELETKERQQYQVPQSFAAALMLAAKQQAQIEEQQKTIKANAEEIVALSDTVAKMQPKVTYYDKILASTATLTVTQVAQDYGMSAKAFNVLLRNFGIQHKVNGQWILYAKYLQQGYVHSKSVEIVRHDGRHETKANTEWLQKGRLFLYEELKKHGILPLIEQNAQ